MTAYYNENDPWLAEMLRNMIAAMLIPGGDVDERSIEDVKPDDLKGYTQCHFFAGVGGWPLALRLAGWPDNRPVWSGSCPCQPFSAAGKGAGFDDERHLWPHWFHLISECRPEAIMGEQVAGKDGLAWLDLVSSDLEGTGHTFWPVDICAAGFGSPQIRQRLYWVAYGLGAGLEGHAGYGDDRHEPRRNVASAHGSIATGSGHGGLGNTNGEIVRGRPTEGNQSQAETRHRLPGDTTRSSDPVHRLADVTSIGRGGEHTHVARGDVRDRAQGFTAGSGTGGDASGFPARDATAETVGQRGVIDTDGRISAGQPDALPTNGFWRSVDWLYGTDGKFRPVEPGTFPMANGVPCRSEQIGAYGNAIVLPQAVEFIKAVM